jgi:hypothetical protein
MRERILRFGADATTNRSLEPTETLERLALAYSRQTPIVIAG